jgi:hypothetical protein
MDVKLLKLHKSKLPFFKQQIFKPKKFIMVFFNWDNDLMFQKHNLGFVLLGL